MAIQAQVTDCWREPLEDDATIVALGVAHRILGRARRLDTRSLCLGHAGQSSESALASPWRLAGPNPRRSP
jgi:hypothetical protein